MADPYITENFGESFIDDIKIITGSHENINQTWDNAPSVLILPVLTGKHWRCIRIEIDYNLGGINLLWDDPYGKGRFPEFLKNILLDSLLEGLKKLFLFTKKEFNYKNLHHDDKNLDQQGNNGSNCGVIVMQNVYDYSTRRIKNFEFAISEGNEYTIKSADHLQHKETIKELRQKDSEICREKDSQAFAAASKNIKNKREEIRKNQLSNMNITMKSSEIFQKISECKPDIISSFFDYILEKRLQQNKDINVAFTEDEIKESYKIIVLKKNQEGYAQKITTGGLFAHPDRTEQKYLEKIRKFQDSLSYLINFNNFTFKIIRPQQNEIHVQFTHEINLFMSDSEVSTRLSNLSQEFRDCLSSMNLYGKGIQCDLNPDVEGGKLEITKINIDNVDIILNLLKDTQSYGYRTDRCVMQ